jgi:tetratricopeptide (TPR) repeat protein
MRLSPFASRVLCAAALLVAGLASPAVAQIGRVGGVVKDEAGQPLKGATITAENRNIGQSFTATTDDKGRFTMIGLRAGTWRFIAQAPGFAPDAGEMPVRMGAPNPPITFALKKSGVANFGALGGIAGKDLQADLSAADALFTQGRWDDAVTAYRAIMEKAPTLGVINLQLAAAYRNKKDYTAALAAYSSLLRSDPNNEKATVGIAMTNLERGDQKAAEDTLTHAAEGEVAGREIFYSLGEIRFAKGDTDEAMRWYQKAAVADPYWGKPAYKLGLCAIQKGDTAGAINFMNQVVAVDPRSSEATLAKSSLDSLKK